MNFMLSNSIIDGVELCGEWLAVSVCVLCEAQWFVVCLCVCQTSEDVSQYNVLSMLHQITHQTDYQPPTSTSTCASACLSGLHSNSSSVWVVRKEQRVWRPKVMRGWMWEECVPSTEILKNILKLKSLVLLHFELCLNVTIASKGLVLTLGGRN